MSDTNQVKRHSKNKVTKIDYSLEQFLAEVKQRELTNRTLEKIVKTLEKLASVQQKQQDLAVLHDFRIKRIEKYATDLGVRLEKMEKNKCKRK